MSPYGLVFPKTALFNRGANPVIYGLDQRSYSIPSGNSGGERIIAPEVLPLPEQYRYVTYHPGKVDWTHEREWRWPFRGTQTDTDNWVEMEDLSSLPGLNLTGDDLNGMGVIVRTAEEAQWLIHDILSLADRNLIGRKQYSWVLSADKVAAAAQLRDPQETAAALSSAVIDLHPYYCMSKAKAEKLLHQFSELVSHVEQNFAAPKEGEIGGCWLWLLDNTHELTRALFMQGRVLVSSAGRYLAWLPEYDDSRGLSQREEMTRKLAQVICSKYNLECGYFSVTNRDDPDGIPFYASDHLDCRLFYNVAWEGLR